MTWERVGIGIVALLVVAMLAWYAYLIVWAVSQLDVDTVTRSKGHIAVHYDGNMDSGIMLDEHGEVAYVVKGKRVTVAEFEMFFKTLARGEK